MGFTETASMKSAVLPVESCQAYLELNACQVCAIQFFLMKIRFDIIIRGKACGL